MSINRITLSRAGYNLQSASDYTQLRRWLSESIVAARPGFGSSSGLRFSFSLAAAAAVIVRNQMTRAFIAPPCILATFYSGGTPGPNIITFTYDGNGVTLPDNYSLLDGGKPDTNFC